jgi:hypothetical protein
MANADPVAAPPDYWELHVMAVDAVTARLERITKALNEAGVPYALVGGQAVAIWVATRDPDAVRTTKDVDILLRRDDLPHARKAAQSDGWDYCEVLGVGMFLERDNPNPKRGIHLIWAGEKVRPDNPLPAPVVEERCELRPGKPVVTLNALVAMKLIANRDHDRAHLRDMIEVGLIGREMLADLPSRLAEQLDTLLTEAGR